MKSLTIAVLLLVSCALRASAEQNNESYDPCQSNGLIEFRQALESFTASVCKQIAFDNDYEFLISPLNLWLSLSAIAEGADASVQHELFEALHLPEQRCLREKFYHIALRSEPPGVDVPLVMNRALLLNENVEINPNWADYVNSTGLMDYFYVDQLSAGENSAIGDFLQYDGLWTTAFSEADMERVPFYNDSGLQIGEIDLMRTHKSMRAARLEDFNAKALELSVGIDGRYTMLIVMGLENHPIREIVEIFPRSIILQITQALHYNSYVPSEVAVPKLMLTSIMNAKYLLEQVGIKKIWDDPAASMYISDPPAVPGEYTHEVIINIGSAGINPAPTPGSDDAMDTEYAADVGEEFIVNKPFMYFLVEAKTNSVIFAGAFNPK